MRERPVLLKIVPVILTLCLTTNGITQDREIDSIRKVISMQRDDSSKVKSLLQLSKAYFSTFPSNAINYAMQAKDLAERLHYRNGEAYALKNLGIANYMQGKFLEALDYYEKALAIFSETGDRTGVANILSNEGAVYFNKSDDARALELYLKSLKVSEEIGDTLRMATALQNIGAVYFNKAATREKSLEYYLMALPLSEATGDKDAIGTVSVNLGEIYLAKGDEKSALLYFEKSLKAYEGSENIPYSLNDIGKLYAQKGDFPTSVRYHRQAYEIARKLDAKLDMAQSLLGVGDTYLRSGRPGESIPYYKAAESIASGISAVNYELKNAYAGMALSYAGTGDFQKAYKYQSLLSAAKDSLYNIDTDKKLSGLQFNFDIQKKQTQIDLLTKDKALQDLDLQQQKLAKNALLGGLVFVFIIVIIIYRDYRTKIKTNKLLDSQKAEIEHLLLNILPEEVAHELQAQGHASPRYYENVSVLFTDFKSFTRLAETLSPQEVVSELNACFIAFDDIIEKYGLEKIKTIGDSYMCAGGIPTTDQTHPYRMVQASLDIQRFISERNATRSDNGSPLWELRIGIHVGSVVAGVVGRKKYAYDIWGNTVNVASRMESNGEPGKVNISSATYELVRDKYKCTYRGKLLAKNIGEVDMYFVESPIPLEPKFS